MKTPMYLVELYDSADIVSCAIMYKHTSPHHRHQNI